MKISPIPNQIISGEKRKISVVLGSIAVMLALLVIGKPTFRLVGAYAGPDGDSMAIIEDTESKRQDVVEPMGSVFGKAEVVNIENGKVQIKYDGQIVSLKQEGAVTENNEEAVDRLASIESLAPPPPENVDVALLKSSSPFEIPDDAVLRFEIPEEEQSQVLVIE